MVNCFALNNLLVNLFLATQILKKYAKHIVKYESKRVGKLN